MQKSKVKRMLINIIEFILFCVFFSSIILFIYFLIFGKI